MSEPGPRWFYILNGRRCGPADLFGLVDLILKQEIIEDALVWHSGLAEWVRASDLPEVRRELPPPVPAAVRGGSRVAASRSPRSGRDRGAGGDAGGAGRPTPEQ